MITKFDTYRLAIKYWLQGDSWGEAVACAKRIVLWFKK